MTRATVTRPMPEAEFRKTLAYLIRTGQITRQYPAPGGLGDISDIFDSVSSGISDFFSGAADTIGDVISSPTTLKLVQAAGQTIVGVQSAKANAQAKTLSAQLQSRGYGINSANASQFLNTVQSNGVISQNGQVIYPSQYPGGYGYQGTSGITQYLPYIAMAAVLGLGVFLIMKKR